MSASSSKKFDPNRGQFEPEPVRTEPWPSLNGPTILCKIFNSLASMRPFHGEMTSKQEAHKLEISIIKLLNLNIKNVLR